MSEQGTGGMAVKVYLVLERVPAAQPDAPNVEIRDAFLTRRDADDVASVDPAARQVRKVVARKCNTLHGEQDR